MSTVTVTRARDPLQGQRLAVLGRMRRHAGVELLVVLADGSKRLVPAAWTDLEAAEAGRAQPGPVGQDAGTLGSVADLLAACAVVAGLAARHRQELEQAARQSPGEEDDRAACPAQSAAGGESGATTHAHPAASRRASLPGAGAAGASDRPSGAGRGRSGGRR